jgi:hypothetical protein
VNRNIAPAIVIIFLALFLSAASLGYASVASLELLAGSTTAISVEGATAAYSLDASVAEASVQSGRVVVRAVNPGKAIVVVVTNGGTESFTVTVSSAPAQGTPAQSLAESGSYFGSYSSSAGQFINGISFESRDGALFRRADLVLAAYVTPSSGLSQGRSGIGLPLISYETSTPGRDIVFFDQNVTVSPLTFQNSLIRGLHVQDGPWIFHGGVSNIAQFNEFIVPADSQSTAGLTRVFSLSRDATLSGNLYDIVNGTNVNSFNSTQAGVIGSLLYSWHAPHKVDYYGEIGLSRSLGFSAGANYDDARTTLLATLLDKPADFASLATNAQQGFFGNLELDHTFSDRFNASLNAQQSDYTVPSFNEDASNWQINGDYRVSRNFSTNAGISYSSFTQNSVGVPRAQSLAIPTGLSVSDHNLTLGLQWQPTWNLAGSYANGYGANAGYSYGPLQVGAFYTHAVNIPTVASIFTEVPGLQAALEAAGINVTSPQQLAALLGNAALLSQLGFANLHIDLAPSQDTTGVTATWLLRGPYHQLLSYTYLDSESTLANSTLPTGTFGFRQNRIAYSRGLGSDNALTLSADVLQSIADNVSTSSRGVGVTFYHRFSSAPAFLFPTPHGSIAGYVFRDDSESGRYSENASPLPNVEVMLDNGQTVRTDDRGRYAFSNVTYGVHRVAAKIESAQPYVFTTDSPATAQVGDVVNFGVSFVDGRLFGSVVNDADAALSSVVVSIGGGKTVTTGDDGGFTLSGLPSGRYTLVISRESLPEGYDLANIAPATADVRPGLAAQVRLVVRALRSVAGTVRVFDPQRGTAVAAAGVVVSIPELGLSVQTDGDGAFLFRNLPAGSLTISVDGGREAQRVTLPTEPSNVTGIDVRITTAQAERARERMRARNGPGGGLKGTRLPRRAPAVLDETGSVDRF